MSCDIASQNQQYVANEQSLVVWQAAPLAWNLTKTGAGKFSSRIEELKLNDERYMFQDIVSNPLSVADLDFRIATIDTFADFMQKCRNPSGFHAPSLHISCHAHPTYLLLESGWGEIEMLSVESLREMLKGTNIKFVFIAACYSRSIGEAFAEAGVPHVICPADDRMWIKSSYAVAFGRLFYSHVFSGHSTVQEAFTDARSRTRAYRYFLGQEFCLLDNHNHEVKVFEDRCIATATALSTTSFLFGTRTKSLHRRVRCSVAMVFSGQWQLCREMPTLIVCDGLDGDSNIPEGHGKFSERFKTNFLHVLLQRTICDVMTRNSASFRPSARPELSGCTERAYHVERKPLCKIRVPT